MKKWIKKAITENAILSMAFPPSIKPGQVYILRDMKSSTNNPFKKAGEVFKVEVIAYKNGWVNFKLVGSDFYRNESLTRTEFNFCYKIIEYG